MKDNQAKAFLIGRVSENGVNFQLMKPLSLMLSCEFIMEACSSPFMSSLGSKHVSLGSAQQKALRKNQVWAFKP